jgi:hypothetical protein
MSMRQVARCVNQALDERSDCYKQSREKEHWMNRYTETNSESNQQSGSRWFYNCEQHFFHNASFSRFSIELA